MTQEVRRLVPGEMGRRNSSDPRSTSSGRQMVAWSSPGSHRHPRRRTDCEHLPTEVNRRSSQGLRHLVPVWRREVDHGMPWNWTKHSDTAGQNGGKMSEVGVRTFSGDCNSALVRALALFLYRRALSYIFFSSPSVIRSVVFLLIRFVPL